MTTRAERLKQARKRVKLTQVEAARQLAKAVSTIKGWESAQGTEPATLDDVMRVCSLYKISVDHYVNGYSNKGQQLSREQQRLLSAFDHLSPAARKSLLKTLEQIADDLQN